MVVAPAHQAEQPGEADVAGVAGDRVDLGGHGDHRELGADDGDDRKLPDGAGMEAVHAG